MSSTAFYRNAALLAVLTAASCAVATSDPPVPDGDTAGTTSSGGSSASGGSGGNMAGAGNVAGTLPPTGGSAGKGGSGSGGTSGAGGKGGTSGQAGKGGSGGAGGTSGSAGTQSTGGSSGSGGSTSGAGGTAGSVAGSGGSMGGSSAGKGGAAGTSAGEGGSAGTSGSAGTGSSDLCDNPKQPETAGNSGSFETLSAVCYIVVFPGDDGMGIDGWGCSNMDGRSVTVNGEPVECGDHPLPAPLSEPEPGTYVFEFTAGEFTWAAFHWY